jgi:hypothetical protein
MPKPPDDEARGLPDKNGNDPLNPDNPEDIDDIMMVGGCSEEEAKEILRRLRGTKQKVDEELDNEEGPD